MNNRSVRELLAGRLMDCFIEAAAECRTELLPAEARKHFRASRKEMLLGVRAILDEAIEKCDTSGQAGQSGPGRSSVRAIPITDES
ncbi:MULTISPECIES: hypothetical protein [unclassified Paenibacillus]|uniref:hypothetical protein n=1 Tax=unclassified Paenibacillus TaxID=185978 RepID=UPI001C10C188|nr:MULTISPECIES: hypothetical protein [unclassified Paenibacillus]MBU5443442.1 hypothetical protein [Paenibacillus sp. MSJ-34]CAH0119410.1 hypothetical protein PAE9249_01911 [Paenibacillus sp. CECT 9249]